jgi:hypothetical protein
MQPKPLQEKRLEHKIEEVWSLLDGLSHELVELEELLKDLRRTPVGSLPEQDDSRASRAAF